MKPKVMKTSELDKEVLKGEVLAELEKENFKKEIVNELQSTKSKSSLSSITKHPAVLLIIGFALTGFVGTWLASSWQKREWDRQQSRLVKIRGVDQKYVVIDETIKAMAENNSIIGEFLGYLSNAEDFKYSKKFDDYVIDYAKKREEWRASSSIIEQKLLIYFRNPQIHELYRQILKERLSMHIRLTVMVGLYIDLKKASETHGWNFKETLQMGEYKLHSDSVFRDLGYAEDLIELINLMTEEIRQDVEGLN